MYFPGWAMQVACFVFIQRRWEDDKKHLENMLDYFCDIREPLQLLLFPEGTDLTGEEWRMNGSIHTCNTLHHISSVILRMCSTNPVFRAQCGPTPVLRLSADTVMQTQFQSDKTRQNPPTLTPHSHFCRNAQIFGVQSPSGSQLSQSKPRAAFLGEA